MSELSLAAVVTCYIGAGFCWPVVRIWRRHRIWPVVFSREAAPAQRVLGLLTRALLVVVLALTAARVAAGPEALGEWRLPSPLGAIGWALVAAGAVITVLAQAQMGASWRVGIDDRPTSLVTGGLFRLVRNPIFSGVLTFLAGYACLAPAWWSVAIWIATATGIRLQISLEERHLLAAHGAAYRAYAARVGRLIPWIGRLPPR